LTGSPVTVTPFIPDVGHGIDDAPVVTDGMMTGMFTATWTFSMAGLWELEIMVDGDDGMDHATASYEVE